MKQSETSRTPSLQELQRWMRDRIRFRGGQDGPLVPLAAFLNPQRGTPGVERLEVYARGYLARIREALAEVYEAVHHVLGEGMFTEVAHAYAARYPSADYNLSVAGRHLPEFLVASPLVERLPFLPDLAQLEWLVCHAFHASDQPPIDPARCSMLLLDDWARARLVFQSSVALVASRWPILDIWQARARPRGEISIDVTNRPQRVLVFRQDLQVRCALLEMRQYEVLEGLLNGGTLGDVCKVLAQAVDEDSIPATAWFAEWMKYGIIQDVSMGLT